MALAMAQTAEALAATPENLSLPILLHFSLPPISCRHSSLHYPNKGKKNLPQKRATGSALTALSLSVVMEEGEGQVDAKGGPSVADLSLNLRDFHSYLRSGGRDDEIRVFESRVDTLLVNYYLCFILK